MDHKGIRACAFAEFMRDLQDGDEFKDLDTAHSKTDQRVISLSTSLSVYESDRRPRLVKVSDEDSVSCAFRHALTGAKVLMLNMASDRVPGGGVKWGSVAQEEDICRRTTLYPSLNSLRSKHYPLLPGTVVYTPGVYIVCDPHLEYLPREKRVSIDVVSSAAVRARSGDDGGVDMDQRIRRLLHVCSTIDHDVLILGAWGCGAFGNDPWPVATSFRNHLSNINTGSDIIIFPVLSLGREGSKNLTVFRRVFSS